MIIYCRSDSWSDGLIGDKLGFITNVPLISLITESPADLQNWPVKNEYKNSTELTIISLKLCFREKHLKHLSGDIPALDHPHIT